MKIFLSIDDTDNLESIGSGKLAAVLAKELLEAELIRSPSGITRHQLFVHEKVPFTSHNSAMCFSAITLGTNSYNNVIEYSQHFLKNNSAAGSDPGLCVLSERVNRECRKQLEQFGCKAKCSILSKQQAYMLADKNQVHLSEHGGTGDGIIGALAGVGLRLTGNDGRFRGWHNLGNTKAVRVHDLRTLSGVEDVVDENDRILPDELTVGLVKNRIKTVLKKHRQVVVVKEKKDNFASWTTLTKDEIRQY